MKLQRLVLLPALLMVAVVAITGSKSASADTGVTLLSSSSHTDSINALHTVGEVRNDTGVSIEFVKVVATYTDADGAFLTSEDTYTTFDVLTPGATSPFDLILISPPAGIAHISLQTQWDAAFDAPFTGLTVLDGARVSKDSIGFRHISGQVRNDSGVPAQFVKVIATFYGADGTVVDTDFTYTKLDTLQPGQVSPFELITQPSTSAVNFKLQVQGSSAQ